MRPMFWFALALVINLTAMDMIVWYADVLAASKLIPLVLVAFVMAIVKSELSNR